MRRLTACIFLAMALAAASGCSGGKTQTPDLSLTHFPTPLPTFPILVTPPAALPTSGPAQASTLFPSQAAPAPTGTASSTVTISSTLQVAPAERVNFDAGATASDQSGSLPAAGSKWYTIGALKGQTMILGLSTAKDDVYIAVTDSSGKALAGAGQRLTSWSGTLPATGDYLVEVTTSGSGGPYDLVVTIPQRIVFNQGAVSATVSGTVGKSRVNSYLTRANAGQSMTVALSSAAPGAALTLYGLQDGQPLVRSAMGATSWSGKLPGTQDYLIEVVSAGDALDYSLKVTIQ
ncbi:MAG TPA: hypothetical protein VGJ97_12805 [Anaerolineaceae bacterium]